MITKEKFFFLSFFPAESNCGTAYDRTILRICAECGVWSAECGVRSAESKQKFKKYINKEIKKK